MNKPLLPCPFCGGEVSIALCGNGFDACWFVTRGHGENACKCKLFMESKKFDKDSEMANFFADDLIAAWNRRAQPSEKPEPLTLGELRQMGGEPIWIKEFPPYAFAGYKVLSLRVVDVYGDIVCEDGDIYEYERYGKTWLAYRAKPKEEHHEVD